MKILAVDTTGAFASVAVKNDDNKIFCETSGNEMNHLQALFPMTQRVLKRAGVSKDELEAAAVSIGPGSFTGIRIGMAAARTMAQALGIPMAAVPTLESFVYADINGNINEFSDSSNEKCTALASASADEQDGKERVLICPMLDARRSQVYAAAYMKSANGCSEAVKGGAYDVGEFLAAASDAAVEGGASCMLMFGDGSDSYASRIKEVTSVKTITVPKSIRYQNAVNVLKMAEALADLGKLCEYNEVKPDYMRKSEAERKLEAGQLGKKKKELKKQRPVLEKGMEIPPVDEKITYRPASLDDLKAFTELDARCFLHAWSEKAFEGELDGSKKTYYVAAENSKGKLIGFAGAAYVVDEGEINRVAVDPLYRGRGIADRMMDMVIADADNGGINALMLEVREANRSAIALYKNHDFIVEGKREGYYAQTGENALLMRRNRKDV